MRSIMICAASVARMMANMLAPRFHIGRTTRNSITTPISATSGIAISAASSIGRPSEVSSTCAIMPPSITKTPCAKFTMPLAL